MPKVFETFEPKSKKYFDPDLALKKTKLPAIVSNWAASKLANDS